MDEQPICPTCGERHDPRDVCPREIRREPEPEPNLEIG